MKFYRNLILLIVSGALLYTAPGFFFPPAALSLQLGRNQLAPGEILKIRLLLSPGWRKQAGDLYVAIQDPDRNLFFAPDWSPQPAPVKSGAITEPSEFAFEFPAAAVRPGRYLVWATIVRENSLELLAPISWQPFAAGDACFRPWK